MTTFDLQKEMVQQSLGEEIQRNGTSAQEPAQPLQING
jgi:hypothetical protein